MAGAIKGLLFDKDGTLFDFAASWSTVIEDTLAALTSDRGLQITMGRATGFDPVTGEFEPGSMAVAGALDEVARIWSNFLPDRNAAEVAAIADEIAEAATGTLVPAVPDLPGLLAELRTTGHVLGIATHDSEAAAHAHIAHARVTEHFAFVAGYDSGHGLKPGPGMLLAFASATGLHPSEIAMIGDSVHDLGVAASAKAAIAIGVLSGPATERDLGPYADHVLPSIGDIPALLARLSRS